MRQMTLSRLKIALSDHEFTNKGCELHPGKPHVVVRWRDQAFEGKSRVNNSNYIDFMRREATEARQLVAHPSIPSTYLKRVKSKLNLFHFFKC